jgi:hypothetical protein
MNRIPAPKSNPFDLSPDLDADRRQYAAYVTEADRDYAAWRADYNRRRREMRARLVDVLTAGGTVHERNVPRDWPADAPGIRATWSVGSGKFVEPFDSNPAYLADHLISRHFGFCWTLDVDGVAYELGRAVQS